MEMEEQFLTTELFTEVVTIRSMMPEDVASVVRIDEQSAGRRRPEYFDLMVERSVRNAGLQVSLVAEIDRHVVGFVIATVYYGEFGIVEPAASIDAIGVETNYRRHRIGRALMVQLRQNLGALKVGSIRTEVDWTDFQLLVFLQKEGFMPAPRLCLETRLDPTAPIQSDAIDERPSYVIPRRT